MCFSAKDQEPDQVLPIWFMSMIFLSIIILQMEISKLSWKGLCERYPRCAALKENTLSTICLDDW